METASSDIKYVNFNNMFWVSPQNNLIVFGGVFLPKDVHITLQNENNEILNIHITKNMPGKHKIRSPFIKISIKDMELVFKTLVKKHILSKCKEIKFEDVVHLDIPVLLFPEEESDAENNIFKKVASLSRHMLLIKGGVKKKYRIILNETIINGLIQDPMFSEKTPEFTKWFTDNLFYPTILNEYDNIRGLIYFDSSWCGIVQFTTPEGKKIYTFPKDMMNIDAIAVLKDTLVNGLYDSLVIRYKDIIERMNNATSQNEFTDDKPIILFAKNR